MPSHLVNLYSIIIRANVGLLSLQLLKASTTPFYKIPAYKLSNACAGMTVRRRKRIGFGRHITAIRSPPLTLNTLSVVLFQKAKRLP